MNNQRNSEQVFIDRMQVIKFIAQRSPRRVGATELAGTIKGSTRKLQRTLKGLTEIGYLTCDNETPKGYKVNKEAFKEIQCL